MQRYLIKLDSHSGISLKIIYGNYFKALNQSVDRKVKTIPANINDDDILYGRIKYDDI